MPARYPEVEGIEDVAGFVERLLEVNCLDLLKVTKKAFALPLPSYSLKKVEAFVGYERVKVPGYKGDQSIARYMLAIETDDEGLRQEIVDEVCAYNNEDLEATWAVMEWLLDQKAKH
ncbi:MAG: ribonuclease H-like domain-containing protein [Chitinophagaceae bacterium]